MFQFANPTVFDKLSQFYFLTSKRTLQNVNSTTIPNFSFYLKFNIWFDTISKFHNVKSSTKYNLLRRVKCHQTNSPLPSRPSPKEHIKSFAFLHPYRSSWTTWWLPWGAPNLTSSVVSSPTRPSLLVSSTVITKLRLGAKLHLRKCFLTTYANYIKMCLLYFNLNSQIRCF